MKISGTATMAASPEQVWQAVHDPGTLARSIPGCKSLTELAPGRYAMTVMAGVAAIKGSYDGEVAITDVTEPDRFTMKADGAGAPGTISTTVDVSLAGAEGGGTSITYEADALVGGPIGGVGQRMLAGVARKMAGQMFTALDRDIAGGSRPEPAPSEGSPEVGGGRPTGVSRPELTPLDGSGPSVGERHTPSYAGSGGSPGLGGSSRDFGSGVLVGGAVALVGVVLGWAIGGRR